MSYFPGVLRILSELQFVEMPMTKLAGNLVCQKPFSAPELYLRAPNNTRASLPGAIQTKVRRDISPCDDLSETAQL